MLFPPDVELRGGLGWFKEEEGGGGGGMKEKRGPLSLLFLPKPSSKAALLCQEGFALEEPPTFQ